jgi:hypothetical protein
MDDAASPAGTFDVLSPTDAPEFSICTLVTRHDEYAAMVENFRTHGFTDDVCEYLRVDNSAGNVLDGYEAVNIFLRRARGRHIVICHQDVLLLDDGADALRARLAELDAQAPDWGVCGNAGMTADGRPAIRITDPHAPDQRAGDPLPRQVVSLDENFLVVRNSANLAVSRDLRGFHHYATDLCIIADILGWSAHVIEFHLFHKSGGRFNDDFFRSREALQNKYKRALRSRWVHTISLTPIFISGIPRADRLASGWRQIGKLVGRVPRNREFRDASKRTVSRP